MLWDAGKARGKILTKLAPQKRLRQEELDKQENEIGELERQQKKDTQPHITPKNREIKNHIKEI